MKKLKKNKKIVYLILLLLYSINEYTYSQIYIPSDPYNLINYEFKQFNNQINYHSTSMRPFFITDSNSISIKYNSQIYLNNNSSNQENMDVRYIGDGIGHYNSLHISGYSKFFAFNFEPYFIANNYNNSSKIYSRPGPFNYLNDTKSANSIKDMGLRKADIYFHYKGLGVGITNDNMWWGPGLQGALTMTNNTVGFNNYMLGTIKELRWKNIGIMGRYTFAELNKKSGWEATYFTAITSQVTFYSEQIISIGLSRNYLTGGVDLGGVSWTKQDAQNIIFEGVFIKNLQKKDYTIAGHDAWDQTISAWTNIVFPKNKLKIYLEIGFNDNRFNFWDFIVHPDHSMASTIGLRKFGLFNNENIIFGFEYANLIKGRHHIFRASPNWYDRSHYQHFTYEGRRWGAHSGSDSDDLLLFIGLITDKWSIIPSFNFERHGVSTYRPPEIKMEYKMDIKYNYKGYELSLTYESQFESHLGFPPDQYFIDEITGVRRTNTFIFRLFKYIHLF